MALELDGISKRFGTVQALDGLSFAVPEGRMFGFLGANGAGKTTTMRIVLGLLRADSGTVTWEDGRPPIGRGGRGATCPRSAACTRACPSWSSSCSSPRCTACRARQAAREAMEWLARFRIAEYADRKRREPLEGEPAEGPVHRDHPP